MSGVNATSCPSSADNSFGPAVAACVRTFDFTLLFEESILSILPSALLILLTPVRLFYLGGRKPVVGGNALRIVKLCVIIAFAAVQIALIHSWARDASARTKTSIAAAALYLVNSVAFAALSFVEHSKSFSPSFTLNVYLIFSVIFDAVRTRTLWMSDYSSSITVPFTISLGLKVLILVLEEWNKTRYIGTDQGECAPEETAGAFSRTLFWWLNELLLTGFSRVLTVEALPAIDRRLHSESLWARFHARWENSPKQGGNALLFTLFASLKWPLLAPVIPRLCLLALTLVQPLMINRFLDFLSAPDDGSQAQKNIGYGLIGAYGLAYLGIAIATAWGQQSVYRFVSMIRGSLVTVIYRKTTTSSIVGLDDAAAVTLMSTDVERVVQGLALMHEIWATILQIAVALFLLYRVVGAAFVVPLLTFIFCGVAVALTGGQAGAKQVGWMKAIEKRVGVTSAMLGAMKGLKLSGLSNKLSIIVTNLRLAEISAARLYRVMLIIVVLISYVPGSLSPVIMFGAYTKIAANKHTVLDSTKIFTALSLVSLITDPLTQLFSALPELFAAIACVGRIQAFILKEPRHDKRELQGDDTAGSVSTAWNRESVAFRSSHEKAAVIERCTSMSTIDVMHGKFGWKDDAEPVLAEVNLSVPPSKLTMIIGKVGCGKSTLLKALLGETPLFEGRVVLSSRDISFCDQNPWMLNQTIQENITGFSKYDAGWYRSVVQACALEADFDQLPQRDQVNVGSKGITLSGGQKQRVAIARAVYSKRPIAMFDDVFSGLDSQTQKHVFGNVFGPRGLLRSQNTTVVLATHAIHLLPSADQIIALEDGKVAAYGTFDTLNQEDGYLHRFGLESNETQHTNAAAGDDVAEATPLTKTAEEALPKTVDDNARRLGDRSVYKYYYECIGPVNTLIFFALLVIWVVMLKFPEIWLKWWGDSNLRNPGHENGKYLGVYALFQVVGLTTLGIDGRHLLLTIVVVSGKKLHSVLLRTVLNAPLSFFAATDTGAIINRFSQDIQLIDAELPIAFLNVTCNVFVCVAQAIMILPASYWLALTYPFLVGFLYLVQKYYLRTSRQLRFLDLEAKSPIYSQFLETLSGLATIRAFSWQDDLIDLNRERLDYSQKPFFLLYSIQRWLNLVLDLMAAALAVIITGVAVATRSTASSGFTGVALFNIMTLSAAMKAAVNVWTILETSIGAVARVKIFEDTTPSEHLPGESTAPPENWPENGEIVVNDIVAAYKDDAPPALDNVSLSVKPGEKVLICGRSGSGKSSFILALLRMIELRQGSITIGGIDISTLPRETVRERLNVIPQDPILLHGTIRENCDPTGVASDEEITDCLHKVLIWDHVEANGGLDGALAPDTFSHGQKQLLCLVRAMLYRSKIVIMDEATSNVDVDTEKTMQQLFQTAFRDATVVAVAHRLDNVFDFDTVAVIDKGVIVERDSPRQLLAWPSVFKTLYETYGSRADME